MTVGSGTGVLMADGAKETSAVVRGKTWHRGGSDWEPKARAKQGSAAGSDNGGIGSGRLRQSWAQRRYGCGSDVRWEWEVRGGGAGQAQGTEGALGRGGGGGEGKPFYKSVWVTERSSGSPRAAGGQISLWHSEIYVLHYHISCKIKIKLI